MNDQLTIFDLDKKNPPCSMLEVIEWVQENPHALHYMERYAREAADSHTKFGINALLERVRWQLRCVDGKQYKCNNNYAPALARILVARNPEFAPFIEMRASHFDKEVIPPQLMRV